MTSGLPCGAFNPAGTAGTPVVDLASRSLFVFDAVIAGSPIKHFIFSLNVDVGACKCRLGLLDLNATASYNGIPFVSLGKPWRAGSCERDRVPVSTSGYNGDCGNYRGLGCRRGHIVTVRSW